MADATMVMDNGLPIYASNLWLSIPNPRPNIVRISA